MYENPVHNEVDVPPMGTCRQECAGYNIGCPPGFVCCQTGCGHICQKNRCPRIKLTPYPFCLTHCPFQGVENKHLKSLCLCYNACMNVRCAKEEMCIPKQPMCDKGTCLPLGVCVNVGKYSEQGLLHLVNDKGFISSKDELSGAFESFEQMMDE